MNLKTEDELPFTLTGRVETGLGPVQVHVVDAQRTHRFDHNTVKLAAFTNSFNFGPPLGPSDLSEEPGYLYRTSDIQILLTKDELTRIALRKLEPAEVLRLLKKFGEFFEIHDDFYDPDTGEALQ